MEKVSQTIAGMDSIQESICNSPKVDKVEEYYQTMCDFYNEKEGDLHIKDGYECPICKNKGFVAKPVKTEFGYWTEMHYYCECQEVRKTLRQLDKSGLGSVISKYTFQNYAADTDWQKSIYNTAASFTKNHIAGNIDSWFFIGGATGAGKTHICTAICREFLKKGKAVRYMLWRDDTVKLKASLTDFNEYGRMINEYKNIEVLYIDDLFKTGKTEGDKPQKPTVADINLAFELLNYRYNKPELITIISSESMITDILDIDEAVGGRIAEKASGYAINIPPDRTKNYRLKDMLVL